MIWLTSIQAIDPQTQELCEWAGPRINADSMEEAQNYCNTHGLGFCLVIGKYIEEVNDEPQDFTICLN